MIRIHTTLESLWLEPEELRTYNILGFCFLVQQGKVRYISEDQYHRETCAEIGAGELWRTRTSDGVFRGIHWYIELIMKNGECYLIDAGSNIAAVAEAGKQLISLIDESVERKEKLTVIDVCQLLDSCDTPNDGAPARLISGKEAEEILAQRSGRQAKFLRTKDWQISIDPFDCEISKTAAFFVFDDDRHKSGAVSEEAFKIHRFLGIYPDLFPEDGIEADDYPLKTVTEYYVCIRTRPETYLLLTGYEEEDNAQWLRKINDWMAGAETLLDLTAAASDGGVPRLMSRSETRELMRYLYDFGFSPLLP